MNTNPMNEREERALDVLISASLLPQSDSIDVADTDIEAALRGDFPLPEGVSLDRIRNTLTGIHSAQSPAESSAFAEEAYALFRKHKERPLSDETQSKIKQLRAELKMRRASKSDDKSKS